jgi:hypothetical protein
LCLKLDSPISVAQVERLRWLFILDHPGSAICLQRSKCRSLDGQYGVGYSFVPCWEAEISQLVQSNSYPHPTSTSSSLFPLSQDKQWRIISYVRRHLAPGKQRLALSERASRWTDRWKNLAYSTNWDEPFDARPCRGLSVAYRDLEQSAALETISDEALRISS